MYIDRWDKYEKERDELTTEKIAQDLQQYYRRCTKDLLIQIIIIPLIYIILRLSIKVLFLSIFDYRLGEIFEISFFSLFLIWILIFIISEIRVIIIGFSLIKKKDFHISTDIVVNKLPKTTGSKFRSARPYTLEFKQSKPYQILDEVNYKWSLLFSSTDKDIYESASLNDEFYLINLGKRKSVIGYNKKHFELKK